MSWNYVLREADAYSKVETWSKGTYTIIAVSNMSERRVDIMIGDRIGRSPAMSNYDVEHIQSLLDNKNVAELRKLFIIEEVIRDGEDRHY